LAFHPWDEPILRLQKSVQEKNLKMTTPMIGEPVVLDKIYPEMEWWKA
jgi:hypothetical protein